MAKRLILICVFCALLQLSCNQAEQQSADQDHSGRLAPASSQSQESEFQQRVDELTKAGLSSADAERAVRMQLRHEAEADKAKEPAHLQPPSFRFYKSRTDAGVAYVVPVSTSAGQLKDLIWFFRKKFRAGHFGTIGITRPTSKNWGELNYRSGLLLVYRGEKCANEPFISDAQLEQGYHGPCGDGEHQDAEYQWGFPPGDINGFFDEGSVKGENGDLWPIFSSKNTN